MQKKIFTQEGEKQKQKKYGCIRWTFNIDEYRIPISEAMILLPNEMHLVEMPNDRLLSCF